MSRPFIYVLGNQHKDQFTQCCVNYASYRYERESRLNSARPISFDTTLSLVLLVVFTMLSSVFCFLALTRNGTFIPVFGGLSFCTLASGSILSLLRFITEQYHKHETIIGLERFGTGLESIVIELKRAYKQYLKAIEVAPEGLFAELPATVLKSSMDDIVRQTLKLNEVWIQTEDRRSLIVAQQALQAKANELIQICNEAEELVISMRAANVEDDIERIDFIELKEITQTKLSALKQLPAGSSYEEEVDNTLSDLSSSTEAVD